MAIYFTYEEAFLQISYKTLVCPHRSRMELQTIEERSFQASVNQEYWVDIHNLKNFLICHEEPANFLSLS